MNQERGDRERGKAGSILIGILLIAAGVGMAGNVLFGWHIDIFFEGWWTLFIIVPCVVSIIRYGVNMRNLAGLAVGLVLFLCARDIIDWWIVGRMLIPIILVLIGLQIIFRRNVPTDSGSEAEKADAADESPGAFSGGEGFDAGNASQDGAGEAGNASWDAGNAAGNGSGDGGGAFSGAQRKEFRAVFGQRKVVYQDEIFRGASVECIFGNVELDLRRAVFTGEERLNVTSMFGAVDIRLPENVNLILHASPVLGTVNNLHGNPSGIPAGTVVIDASSTLGTVRIQ